MATITKRTGKNGTTYRVQVRVKGYPLESASFDRLTDAKRWAADTESAIKAGKHFGAARRRTFDDLADEYEESMVGTLKSDRDRVTHLARWRAEFGSKVLEDLTPAAISKVRDKLLKEATAAGTIRTPATVNRFLATLSACFTHGVKQLEWLERNPVSRVTKGKETKGRVRFLSDEERIRLLKECRESSNPHLYTAVVLALSTGARQDEIMSSRWPQVDFKRRTIQLLEGETKNEEGRVLPLTGEAFQLLEARAQVRDIRDDRVFPVPALGRPFGSLKTAWAAALKRSEIKDFRWHDLRHTAASYLTMAGVSSTQVAKILGHKTLQMTARYSHLSPEHIVEAGDLLSDRLGLGGKSNTAA